VTGDWGLGTGDWGLLVLGNIERDVIRESEEEKTEGGKEKEGG
jgi:hypothetical protein